MSVTQEVSDSRLASREVNNNGVSQELVVSVTQEVSDSRLASKEVKQQWSISRTGYVSHSGSQ